jgi:hypothetical protein
MDGKEAGKKRKMHRKPLNQLLDKTTEFGDVSVNVRKIKGRVVVAVLMPEDSVPVAGEASDPAPDADAHG